MAHLVGHVVHGIEVTGRGRDTRAAARLVLPADDAEVGNPAAWLAERQVADVVVRGADDLADHDAGPCRARAGRDLRLGEASRGATWAVRIDGVVPRVEVEQVVV